MAQRVERFCCGPPAAGPHGLRAGHLRAVAALHHHVVPAAGQRLGIGMHLGQQLVHRDPAIGRRARAAFPDLPLEIECRTLAQVAAALEARPDLILLDNMTREDLAGAVRLAGGLVRLEASGGIELEDLGAVSATGVDFVSMGALTHSAPAMDINLKFEPIP